MFGDLVSGNTLQLMSGSELVQLRFRLRHTTRSRCKETIQSLIEDEMQPNISSETSSSKLLSTP